jgi:hypothetical protein
MHGALVPTVMQAIYLTRGVTIDVLHGDLRRRRKFAGKTPFLSSQYQRSALIVVQTLDSSPPHVHALFPHHNLLFFQEEVCDKLSFGYTPARKDKGVLNPRSAPIRYHHNPNMRVSGEEEEEKD